MYDKDKPANRKVFDYIYRKFGEEVSGKVSVNVKFSFDEINDFSSFFYFIGEKDGLKVRYGFENYLSLQKSNMKDVTFTFYGLNISKKNGAHQFFFIDSNGGLCCLFFDLGGKDRDTNWSKRYNAVCSAPEFCRILENKMHEKEAGKVQKSEDKLVAGEVTNNS